MNIDYLHSTIHRWKGLIDNFEEAEKQLYVNPVLSIISSRRAMEWLVKDIYKSNCDYYDINLTVFEMINPAKKAPVISATPKYSSAI